MVFLYKRQNIKKNGKKIRLGFECMGCQRRFSRRRDMAKHQGEFWPWCEAVKS